VNAAPGLNIGIGFLAAAAVFALRKQRRVVAFYLTISVLAFLLLYCDGSFNVFLETLSLFLILISGIGLLTRRGQLFAVKRGLGGGSKELGIFLIFLAIVGAVGIIMSALA
jgi:hypothetical protein